MKKIYIALSVLIGTFSAQAQSINLSETNASYNQNFDSLAISGSMNTFMPHGWYYKEVGNTTYADGYYGTDLFGGINPNIFSLGDDAANAPSYLSSPNPADRALGLQIHKVFFPNPRIGAKITNADLAKAIGGFQLNYRGETWNQYAPTQVDTLKFYYSLDADSLSDPAATWINIPSLDYTMIAAYNALDGYFYNYAGNMGFPEGYNYKAVVGSAPFNTISVNPGESFYISWKPTCDVGTYSTIGGIDDVNFTALFGPVSVGDVNHANRDFNVSIYPNPVVNTINVTTAFGKGEVNYTILNTLGHVLKSGSYLSNSNNDFTSIDASHLPTGVYMIKFQSGDNEQIIKNFVK